MNITCSKSATLQTMFKLLMVLILLIWLAEMYWLLYTVKDCQVDIHVCVCVWQKIQPDNSDKM